MPTAAVVIIGREILTGKFADENGPFFIQRLRGIGCSLIRIATVDDDRDAIADEVQRCSQLADHVFTTGGVGPTHDDVTLEAIGQAFGQALRVEEKLLVLMDRFGIPRTTANLRMAAIPEGATLVDDPTDGFPLIRVENVWVLPGVPRLMQRKFEVIAPTLRGPSIVARRLLLDVYETAIADELATVAMAHPEVDIGSYPRFGEGETKVILTLESTSMEAVDAADAALSAAFDVKGRIE